MNHQTIYLLAYSLSTYILPIAEPAKIYKTQYVIQRSLQRLRHIPIRIIWIWHETRRTYNNLRFMKILLTHSKTYIPIFHIISEESEIFLKENLWGIHETGDLYKLTCCLYLIHVNLKEQPPFWFIFSSWNQSHNLW